MHVWLKLKYFNDDLWRIHMQKNDGHGLKAGLRDVGNANVLKVGMLAWFLPHLTHLRILNITSGDWSGPKTS